MACRFQTPSPQIGQGSFVFFFTLLAPSSSTAKSLESLVPLPLLELGHGKASSQGTGKGATLADEDGADFALTLQGILASIFRGAVRARLIAKAKGFRDACTTAMADATAETSKAVG